MGDNVLVKNANRTSKFVPYYFPDPYIITDINGSMISAVNKEKKRITRNSSFFKLIHGSKLLIREMNDIIRNPETEIDMFDMEMIT